MKLNTSKIDKELKRIGKSRTWIARELNMSQQRVDYWFQSQTIKGAEHIAKVLDVDPKDLLTTK
jgi:lambda repressor-like predicted transcriptional regulator